MFMEAQRYKMKESIYYHDNASAMKLKKNRKMSCEVYSRHIKTRCCFAKKRGVRFHLRQSQVCCVFSMYGKKDEYALWAENGLKGTVRSGMKLSEDLVGEEGM